MGYLRQWLTLHGFTANTVQDVIAAFAANQLLDRHCFVTEEIPADDVAIGITDRAACYDQLVIPAILAGFDGDPRIADRLEKVTFADPEPCDENIPRTENNGRQEPPNIVMGWDRRVDDLMCLAHEAGHALQIMLSGNGIMPPVGRETCAFVAELLLLDYTRQHAPGVFHMLHRVWLEENAVYLDSDLEALSASLRDPDTRYHYRQNYPLARLAAVYLFSRGQRGWLKDLFSAGQDGMKHLPIEAMANLAGGVANYLPPMPAPDTEQPAVNAYRSIGAMALLDIDFWKGEPEERIEDYYAKLLRHLQDQTAFIALNPDRKPVGYATWQTNGDAITLTRQAAPFGDHLTLQRALERHLEQPAPIPARHMRSARQEQIAW